MNEKAKKRKQMNKFHRNLTNFPKINFPFHPHSLTGIEIGIHAPILPNEHIPPNIRLGRPGGNTPHNLFQLRKFPPISVKEQSVHGGIVVNEDGIFFSETLLPFGVDVGESSMDAARFEREMEDFGYFPRGGAVGVIFGVCDVIGEDVVLEVDEAGGAKVGRVVGAGEGGEFVVEAWMGGERLVSRVVGGRGPGGGRRRRGEEGGSVVAVGVYDDV